MAFQIVRIFTSSATGNSYTIRYNPDTQEIETTVFGSQPVDQPAQEQDIGAEEGDTLSFYCVGSTLHEVRATMFFPYAYVGIIPNSSVCGWGPSPQPAEEPVPIEQRPPSEKKMTVYQIRIQNYEKQIVTAWIYDMDTYAPGAEAVIYDLKTEQGNYPEAPIAIRTIDNDENKFTGIRAKECVMQFYSTSKYDISTFATGDDKRWYVKCFIGEEFNVIFQGYLLPSELSQPYQPNVNVVQMIATDGLAGLKDIPLVDADGRNPKNKHRVIQYLAWALMQTKLNLPISAVHNLSEETPTAYVPFLECLLDAKTFEAEINVSEDCYTVIEKILGHDAFLHQHRGRWWIQRIDELEGIRRVHQYSYVGGYEHFTDMELTHEIGPGKAIIHIQEDQLLSYERPRKSAKLAFRYEYPVELINNIDFSQGAPIVPMGGANWQAFELDGWGKHRGTFTNPQEANGTVYIRREYEDAIEKLRYVHVQTTQTNHQWLQSSPVSVGKDDRISFALDFRLSARGTITGFVFNMQVIHVDGNGVVRILVADPKQVILGNSVVKWVLYSNQTNGVSFSYDTINPEGWYHAATGGMDIEVPDNGEIYLLLPYMPNDTIHYKDVEFSYKPYINGAYTKYTGHYNLYSHSTKDTEKYDAVVYIGDAPRKMMKGHIFTTGNNSAKRFFNGLLGLPPQNPAPYGRHQALAVWNQYNRFFTVLDGSMQGLKTNTDDVPDCIYLYRFTDPHRAVNNKYFMLLGFEQNLYTCEWRATAVEVFDTNIGRKGLADDPWGFRYLEGR